MLTWRKNTTDSNTTEANIPTVVRTATIEQAIKTPITIASNLFRACHLGVTRETTKKAAIVAAAAPSAGIIQT